ncbi:MAG TPA: single-stranded DNA-binding protein [Patescibacteria group bacterium]|nr:single-stranded DNA-binding protein [Patescibacteria group bacterium]
MSRSLNRVTLIGNVGKDPDVSFTQGGIPVARLSLATSESWKDREGHVQEHTDWHFVVLWRGLAEIAQKYVRKGSKIYVEGKLKTRSYEEKDGTRKYVTEIVAENVLLLDRQQSSEQQAASSTQNSPAAASEMASNPYGTSDDDIPF